MSPSLSNGALLTICQGGQVDKPVLQILGFKKIVGNNTDRYRVFISDGVYSNSFSMLATQMNDKIVGGQLETFTIVRANNYICNNLQNKKVIILLDVDVLQPGAEVGQRLGQPVQIHADGTVTEQEAKAAGASNPVKRAAEESINAPQAKRSPLAASENRPRSSIMDPRPVVGSSFATADPNSMNVFPIASLTPYQNKWTIKARVTNKSDIRRWSNSRGEGHLFSMDLLDESGEIRATAFKEQCDKYYNIIEVGKLYYITSCALKAANKQYSNLNNDYEMSFRDNTEVIPCNDDESSIPTLTFDFVKIGDLANVPKDSIVDVIGICKTALEAATIVSRASGKELVKRDIVIVDQTLTEINLTLWGTRAETFDSANNPVVAVKHVKTSDYNGVSLSALSSSVIQINPDLPQAHALKGWFDSEGSRVQTSSLTQSGGRSNDMGIGSNMKTLGEIKGERIGMDATGKPEFYSTSGYITMFQKDKALYQGCTRVNDGKPCQKKVLDQNNGSYRCEKCNIEIDDFNWRLIMNFSVADMTEQQWATCFQDQAEQILGISAQELGTLFTTNQEQYNKIFANVTFKQFNFRFSCKAESYNDEQKVRHSVRSVAAMDWNDHIRRLIKELEENGVELPENFDKKKYM